MKKKRCHFVRALLGCLLFCMATESCTDNIGDEYARFTAFLRVTPVTGAAPLYEALNNPGQFCTISFTPSHYVFTRPNNTSAQLNMTALEAYGHHICIAGFIVGTPSIPDLTGNFYQIVFDSVCPNCYNSDAIQRTVKLNTDETATCSRCNRVYSLKNEGIVLQGEKGRNLYRYRFSYAKGSDTFVVQN